MAESEVEEERCAICFEVYVSPKLLPCFHIFCAACLRKYIKKNVANGLFSCPICRKVISLPENGVAGFQTNFYITSGDDSLEGRGNTCTACDVDAEAEFYCEECDLNLCTGCSAFHRRMKATKDHILGASLKEDDMDSAHASSSQNNCKDHSGAKVNNFCTDCSQIVCEECLVSDHKGHSYSTLTDEANRVREKLKCALKSQDFTDRKSKCKDEADNAKLKVQDLTRKLDNAIKKCRDDAAAIREITTLAQKEKEEILAEHLLSAIKSNRQTYEESWSRYESACTISKTAQEVLVKDDVTMVTHGSKILENILYTEHGDYAMKSSLHDGDEKRLHERLSAVDSKCLDKIGRLLVHSDQTVSELKSIGITKDKLRLKKQAEFSISACSAIAGIAPVEDGMAWIQTDSGIHLLDSSGTVYQSVSCYTRNIMAGEDHTCLVASGKTIQIVTPSGITKDFITVGKTVSRFAVRTHSTDTWNGVYTGRWSFSNMNRVYTVQEMYWIPFCNKEKECLIEKLGTLNDVMVALDKTSDKIAVAEKDGKTVRILSAKGELLAHYQRGFQPLNVTGIFFDWYGCIILVNSKAGEILRVVPDGLLREVLLEGLDQPLCAGIDSNHKMWLGGQKGQITIYKITKW